MADKTTTPVVTPVVANVTLIKYELRPVSVAGVDGLFHCWNTRLGKATIEFVDGSVSLFDAGKFLFLDSVAKFAEINAPKT